MKKNYHTPVCRVENINVRFTFLIYSVNPFKGHETEDLGGDQETTDQNNNNESSAKVSNNFNVWDDDCDKSFPYE